MPQLGNITDDNLVGTFWLGKIVDVEDPNQEGRCRIRIFGKLDARVNPDDPNSDYLIPDEHLPWAYPNFSSASGSISGSGQFSVPKLGSVVSLYFDNGNIYTPIYLGSVHPSDEVKTEIGNSYQNSHVLIYDTAFGLDQDGNNGRSGESIKLFFTEERGLVIDYATTQGSSIINLKPDNSIEIISVNNTEITCKDAIIKCENIIIDHSTSIELGSGASEKLVLGDSFLQFFNQHTHIANLGAPTSPPIVPMTPLQHLSKKQVKTK
jgi:hypothetical protein